jgi:hypothetical protein
MSKYYKLIHATMVRSMTRTGRRNAAYHALLKAGTLRGRADARKLRREALALTHRLVDAVSAVEDVLIGRGRANEIIQW